MLTALAATDVPVPEVLLQDAGSPPEVPSLFIMSMIAGESFEPLFDEHGTATEAEVAHRYVGAAQTMARLHRLDPVALGCHAEPHADAATEIDRWSATLATVDPTLAAGWQDVRDALRHKAPEPVTPSVVHGDFRLGNLLARGSAITAVIDWEIWSVGDPRIDAGWFLINCDPQTYRRATAYAGVVPDREELVAHYAAARGTEISDLDYFQALACFKSVATWSLIVKHNRRSPTPRTELEAMAAVLPWLLERTKQLLG